MSNRVPAEVFPPGEFLREELEARGWTQGEFADILRKDPRSVSEIITGKRALSYDMAKRIAAALGTTAEFWMALESSYQLSKTEESESDAIAHSGRLREKAPIREMVRRGWITNSENAEVIEKQLLRFFNITSLDEEPKCGMAARKSTSYESDTISQKAWMCRAFHLSRAVHASRFDILSFKNRVSELRAFAQNAEDVRLVPRALAELGVKLLVVQHLPGTRIDGACFLGFNEEPVIALTLRFDRIDWFWHTLGHEIAHIVYEDYLERDHDLDDGMDDPEFTVIQREARANAFAAEFLIRRDLLDDFINRVKPLYSAKRIEAFSKLNGIHPGIAVGQLQHRQEVPYANLRKMLVPVNSFVVDSVLTDGWGHIVPSFFEGDGVNV